ncbi:MAG: hypothetical protein JST01_10765 [Cyanobacteria bacterium SZAS TMP-1]|nr:hypothetical protein [Cyanobacteria bacterium SZAS TMP-1]
MAVHIRLYQMALAAVLIISTANPLPVGASDNALLIKQTSYIIGISELTFCKKGIRFYIPARQLVLIMAPPAWNVQLLNLQSKLYCECPPMQWRPQMASATSFFRPGDPSGLVSVSSVESTIQGLKCRKHTLKLPASQNSGGSHTWEQLLVRSAELYAIDDPELPRSAKTIIARTLGSIKDAGIPLVLTCTNNRRELSQELRMTSQKTVPIKPADFQIPKGFKLVKTATEVTNTTGAAEGFSEFIR